MKRSIFLLLILISAIFLFSAACNLSARDANIASGNQSSDSAAKKESGAANNAPVSPSETEAKRVLEAKWYQDANGNAIPDFIEIENGYDPTKDAYLPTDVCGGGANGENFNAKPVNSLLILDSSGSMKENIGGGTTKIAAAKEAIASHVAGSPENVRFGLMVYGHKGNNQASGKAESCAGSELLAPFGEINKSNVNDVLSRFEPTGWTPIAASLEKSRVAFDGAETAENHIVLVTDGIETCGGDPVTAAKRLHNEAGIKVTIDVVGFNVSSKESMQLRRIASAGGGEYYDAKNQADLNDYFKRQAAAFSKTIGASNCYYEKLINSNTCETNLMIKAFDKINEQITAEHLEPYGETEAKWKAFDALRQRIQTLYNERTERFKPMLERARQLSDQGFDINHQSIESYDKLKQQTPNR